MSIDRLKELRKNISKLEHREEKGTTVNIIINNAKLVTLESNVKRLEDKFKRMFVLGWNNLNEEESLFLEGLQLEELEKNLKAAGLQLDDGGMANG